MNADSESLTPRQREILALICSGLPSKLIARRLGISLATVEHHCHEIYLKLGATNRVEAVCAALRRDLCTLPPEPHEVD